MNVHSQLVYQRENPYIDGVLCDVEALLKTKCIRIHIFLILFNEWRERKSSEKIQ